MQPVYRALLEQGGQPAAELAARLGRDEVSVRESLARLAELSLVRALPGTPATWSVVAPELALGALLARQDADLARRSQEARESRAAAMSLLAAHEARRSETADAGVTRLHGHEEIRLGLDRLCRQAAGEIAYALLAAPGPQHVREGEQGTAERALARGVRIRALHLTGARNSAVRSAYGRRLADSGAEIRTAATLPVPMIVVDRSVAVVQRTPDDEIGTSSEADLVTSPVLVTALYALFEREWAAALPGDAPPQRRENGLSDQEHALLELLCEGLTDEMAARRLGVSLRTVRRTMSDLLTRTGVKSRFQIGMVTGANGWLDSPPGGLRAVPGPGANADGAAQRRTA
ncbi:helix-turn-helix domain-containing protein [Streptomyces sp. NPDC005808]|uniref:helix-turn-helix domain-containing protein n=1 Tax=Streptomyces sp. NPDC005808 TaxID=3364734 RepID=UPI00368F2B91